MKIKLESRCQGDSVDLTKLRIIGNLIFQRKPCATTLSIQLRVIPLGLLQLLGNRVNAWPKSDERWLASPRGGEGRVASSGEALGSPPARYFALAHSSGTPKKQTFS